MKGEHRQGLAAEGLVCPDKESGNTQLERGNHQRALKPNQSAYAVCSLCTHVCISKTRLNNTDFIFKTVKFATVSKGKIFVNIQDKVTE